MPSFSIRLEPSRTALIASIFSVQFKYLTALLIKLTKTQNLCLSEKNQLFKELCESMVFDITLILQIVCESWKQFLNLSS